MQVHSDRASARSGYLYHKEIVRFSIEGPIPPRRYTSCARQGVRAMDGRRDVPPGPTPVRVKEPDRERFLNSLI
jgi:hypothetical protein